MTTFHKISLATRLLQFLLSNALRRERHGLDTLLMKLMIQTLWGHGTSSEIRDHMFVQYHVHKYSVHMYSVYSVYSIIAAGQPVTLSSSLLNNSWAGGGKHNWIISWKNIYWKREYKCALCEEGWWTWQPLLVLSRVPRKQFLVLEGWDYWIKY